MIDARQVDHRAQYTKRKIFLCQGLRDYTIMIGYHDRMRSISLYDSNFVFCFKMSRLRLDLAIMGKSGSTKKHENRGGCLDMRFRLICF